MHICLSHFTALSYLLRTINPRVPNRRYSRANSVPPHAPNDASARSLLELLKGDLSDSITKLDILVSTMAGRASTAAVTTHLCTSNLPSASLIPTETWGKEFYVCCPELVFLQMAGVLDLDLLIYAGYALCSSFRLDNFSPGGCAYRDGRDTPLTSRDKIASFLDKLAPGTRNLKLAQRALTHVHDGARSPIEAGIAMLVSMPTRLGGYALGEVELNREILVYDGIDRYGDQKRTSRIPDVLIKATDRKGKRRYVGIDYDASATHDDRFRIEQDIERRNLLGSVGGFTHFTLRTRHTKNYYAFDQEVDRMRRALGQRKKPQTAGNPDSEENRRIQTKAKASRIDLWNRVLGDERLRL